MDLWLPSVEERAHCVQDPKDIVSLFPMGEDVCDKQKTVELHSCLKTLVADNSPKILRLSHALPHPPPTLAESFVFRFRII